MPGRPIGSRVEQSRRCEVGWKVFNGAVREEREGKVYWRPSGYTLFQNDEGHLSMVDARGGNRVSFFPVEKKSDSPAAGPAGREELPF